MYIYDLNCDSYTGSTNPYSPKEIDTIFAQSNEGKNFILKRHLTFPKGATLKRRVFVEPSGNQSLVLDMNGGSIDTGNKSGTNLVLRSKLTSRGWCQLKDVVVKNGTLLGAVRIYGVGINGEDEYVKDSSHSIGHTERMQAISPTDITLRNMTIDADNNTPIYLSPGVTYTTIVNSSIKGHRPSVAVYFDAESSKNRFINNNISTTNASNRELFAIDGSSRNLIRGNTFNDLQDGGIYIYRNCGEGGTVRHQKPMYNVIENNKFVYINYKGSNPAVFLGSRQGNRDYCGDDDVYNFGSSVDNRDFARHNIVRYNDTTARNPWDVIKNNDINNTIIF